MPFDDCEFDDGEGAYYIDEENRRTEEVPFPDELWDKEFEEEGLL